MNELQQVLNNIKQDKNTNLLPGNLRDNVTCLGVEGTAEVPETIYKPSSYYYDSLVITDKVRSALYVDDWFIYSINDSKAIVCYYNNNKVCQFDRTRTDDVRISCMKLGTDYIIIIITQWNQRDNLVYKININGQVSQLNSINVNTYYSDNHFTRDGDLSIDGDLCRYDEDTQELISKYSLSRVLNANFRGLNNFLYDNLHNNDSSYNTITKYTYNSDYNTYSVLQAKVPDVDGVTYNGDKIVKAGNIYQLGPNLEVGSLLKPNVLPHLDGNSGPVINWIDSSMCEYNHVIYNFDDDNNTFTSADDLPMHTQYVVNSAAYLYFKYNNTYTLLKTKYSDVEVGYNYKGNYFPKSNIVFNSGNILQGNTYYTDVLQPVAGTMPNNGELNITPTTENQNIPEGYTLGGTVLGDANLKSENIKKDVSIFGVTGSLESSLGGVKLFETEEEMQADETAKEGDMAVVYREEIQNMTVDTQTQYITFPETVVLPEAITTDYRCTYKYIDDTPGSFSVRLDNNTFSFSKRGTPVINITYTSVDGITYNRDEFTVNTSEELTNPVDLDGVIYINITTQWNDNFGYFMRIGGMTFKGLYNYGEIIHNDYIQLSPISSVSFDYENKEVSNINYTGEVIGEPISIEKVKSIYNSISEDIGDLDLSPQYEIFLNKSQELYLALGVNNHEVRYFYTTTDCQPLGFGESINSSLGMYVYRIDLENNSYELVDSVNGTGASAYSYIPYDDILTIPIMIRTSSTIPQIPTFWRIIDSSSTGATNLYLDDYIGAYPLYKSDEYQLAPTQLNATSEYVYEKEFYGKNGVETGTLGTPDNSFADTNAEIVYKIQNQYENMEPRVLTDDDKTIDKNMYFIPVKKDGTPLLDTSKVLNLSYIFTDCKNLTEIPLINTSNATDMTSMFSGCRNLTEIPLINTSSAIKMTYMFYDCENLTTIPLINTEKVTDTPGMFNYCINLISVPQLNLSNTVSVLDMFAGCVNLTTVPVFNLSKINTPLRMFDNCPNLSDESLNNILASCITATNITNISDKTLHYIGLSENQANICMNLSNYQNFINSGWTTGY